VVEGLAATDVDKHKAYVPERMVVVVEGVLAGLVLVELLLILLYDVVRYFREPSVQGVGIEVLGPIAKVIPDVVVIEDHQVWHVG